MTTSPVLLTNLHTLLVLAPSTMGKTYSLRNIGKLGNALHIDADRKPLPFKPKGIATISPEHPKQIFDVMTLGETNQDVKVIVIDTLTQLGDDYVSTCVKGADDTRAAWSSYQHYLKDVVLRIKRSQKPYIIMAHEDTVVDEGTGIITRKAPFQGGYAKIGLEASFTTIIGCTSIRPSTLDKKFHNSLLNITPEEKEEDHKYVFQTRRTAGTMGVKYRAPAGMWKPEELYIDNDVVLVMQRISEFYGK